MSELPPELQGIDPVRIQFLVDLRKAVKPLLSQTKVAKHFGLDPKHGRKTIGAWENGEYAPDEKLRRAKFIGYLLDMLLLRRAPEKFEEVWQILVEEWRWRPIGDAERKDYSIPRPKNETEQQQPHSHTDAPPPEAAPIPLTEHFIGRKEELERYTQQLEQERFVFIGGLPGIGKTYVAAELAQRSARKKNIFWHACYPTHDINSITWHLAEFFALRGKPEIWNMLHEGNAKVPPDRVTNYVLRVLREESILVCIDDLHLIGKPGDYREFIKLLIDVSVSKADAARFIVTTQQQFDNVIAEDALLQGLGRADTQKLLELNGVKKLAPKHIDKLHQRTEGNAKLLIFAVDALKATRTPTRIINGLTDHTMVEQYLLQEIHEHLSDDEHLVMDGVSALLGYPGTRHIVEKMIKVRGARAHLAALANRYLLQQQEHNFVAEYKQHAIVQAFYYDMLGDDEREEMHLRAAEYYEEDEYDYFRAALHYSCAKDHENVARLAVQDIWYSINRGYTRKLLELLSGIRTGQLSGEEKTQVFIAQGQVHAVLGNYETAIDAYDAALNQLSNQPASTENLLARARIHHDKGDLLQYDETKSALETLQAGVDLLRADQSDEEEIVEVLAALYIKLGSAQLAAGQLDEAEQSIDAGIKLLDNEETPLYINALINRAYAEYDRGSISKSIEYSEEALGICEELAESDEYRKANLYSNLGMYKFINDQWQDAIADMKSGLDIADRIGSALVVTRSHVNLGTAYIRTGDFELAREHLTTGEEMARKHQLTEQLVLSLGSLAELNIKQNQPDEALQQIDEAEKMHRERSFAEDELIELLRLRAEAKLQKNLIAEALADATSSVEIATRLEMMLEEGVSQRTLGQTSYAGGNLIEGDNAFQKSVDLLKARSKYETARTQMIWGQLNKNSATHKGKNLLVQARQTFKELDAKYELEILQS